jgi:hypothetical protein
MLSKGSLASAGGVGSLVALPLLLAGAAQTDAPIARASACTGPLVKLTGATRVPFRDNDVKDRTRFDLRGWSADMGLVAKQAFSVGANGPQGVCVSGGLVDGHIPPDWNWRRTHTHGGYAYKTVVGGGEASVEDVRVHNVEDGWKPREQPPFNNRGVMRMRGAYMTAIRDDAIEDDGFMPGSIEDSLFDGVWTFLSEQNQESGSPPDTIGAGEDPCIRVDRVYVRLWTTNGGEAGPGHWFKWQPRGAKPHVVTVVDSVFATHSMPRLGWKNLGFPPSTRFEGRNYILWLGTPGEYRGPRPAGVVFLEGQPARDKWNQVRVDWLAAHGYDPRPTDDWDPMDDPVVAPRLREPQSRQVTP